MILNINYFFTHSDCEVPVKSPTTPHKEVLVPGVAVADQIPIMDWDLGIEDDLWRLMLNNQSEPEPKHECITSEVGVDVDTTELIHQERWLDGRNTDSPHNLLSSGVKRRILDLALGEMVSYNLYV